MGALALGAGEAAPQPERRDHGQRAATHPAAQNVYNEGLHCSWQEVLATYGYNDPTGKSQVCTLTQVANRDACEGPP